MLKYLLAIAGLLTFAPQLAFSDPAPIHSPREYCLATGGTVQTRTPEYGTNGGTPLVLAGTSDFCQYSSADGSTQISVLMKTLTTTKPTLAALACYAKPKVNLRKCEGGPGSCYCADVGGTDNFGGITAAGGGWVLSSNVNDVLDVCVFPDLSAIDAYGLFYHSHNIIRGQNLDHKLRYPDPY
jgi:putative hemolysin